ncbi:MAG: flagellum-specific ATP synthase FliI, partial [Planctomycetota bacterium]
CVAVTRRHMAEYRKNQDLISIGAYKQGTDPKVDAAIALRDPIRTFLIQQSEENSPLAVTQKSLQLIAKHQPSLPAGVAAPTPGAQPQARPPAQQNRPAQAGAAPPNEAGGGPS